MARGAAPAAGREPGRRPGEGMSKLRPEAKGGDGGTRAWEPLGTDRQHPRSTPRATRCSRHGRRQAPERATCAGGCCRKGRRGGGLRKSQRESYKTTPPCCNRPRSAWSGGSWGLWPGAQAGRAGGGRGRCASPWAEPPRNATRHFGRVTAPVFLPK